VDFVSSNKNKHEGIMEKTYLTTRELMETFKVSRQTILNWRKQGMPYEALSPQTFRYEFTEIMKWMRQRAGQIQDAKNE
jgi:phage terminase Nu1 subunit (DNA packaging protein)